MMWEQGSLQINKLSLRSHSEDSDPLLSQFRVESLLDAAHLQPVGLSSSAILCIRKLRDPLPGSMQLRSGAMRTPQVWEQAFTASVDRMARSAVRPALEAVPANAEAVIFSDRAELLACLASDWCDGSLIERWWWRSLFKGLDSKNMVLNAWFEAPEYAPAALEHLAKGSKVVPFVRKLSISDARKLLHAVISRFAMPELAEAVAVIPEYGTASSAEMETVMAVGITVHEPNAAFLHDEKLCTAPWQHWVPESAAGGLNQVQQCLLGVGLMLVRAPGVVRSHAFEYAVRQWNRTEPGTERGDSIVLTTASKGISSTQPDDPTAETVTSEHNSLPNHIESADGSPAQKELSEGTQQIASQQLVASVQLKPDEWIVPKIVTTLVAELPAPHQEETANTSALLEVSIATKLGGIFYLINLGIFLNLYGDFTNPIKPGIPLSIWDFLALIGRRLMGDTIEADPVWLLLAQLAGRSANEAPGKNFEPPDRWQLLPEWLTSFPEKGVWRWTAKGGRLRVQHAEGYLILDLPLETDHPLAQVRMETDVYGQVVLFELKRGTLLGRRKETSPLERWLDWLLPYLRARLSRALGLGETDDLLHILCRHTARVSVTPAHIDINFALDHHPIEIRLAGLDRNPGWVPAAGRFIAFHYE